MKNICLLSILFFISFLIIFIIYNCKKQKENMSDSPPFLIDIVYTWGGENMDQNNAREASCNELKYSLRSIFKNIPWFNKIYIVINTPVKQNKPSWFNNKYSDRIILVDQNEIFPEEKRSQLPCKVSGIIYTYLHLIPDLEEHYLYLNDDFFINKPLQYTEFFDPDGTKLYVHGSVRHYEKMNYDHNKYTEYPYIFNKHHHYVHIPYAITKSSTIDYINKYSEWIDWVRNLDYNKRRSEMCELNGLYQPCFEHHYPYYIYMYINEKAIINNNLHEYNITAGENMLIEMEKLSDKNSTFVIQSGISKYKNDIVSFLDNKYPTKLYFEK